MKLALGTAQFGLDYGIANQQGQISTDEARSILSHALAEGINTLDTAIAYGSSEQRLGELGIEGWRVISKLPAAPSVCSDMCRWVVESFEGSLQRLRIAGLQGLLLHRPQQLLEAEGEHLYAALQQLKRDGLVQKIGISIYDPAELDVLHHRFSFDIVQAPFNILDHRLIDTGWMGRLKQLGTELHVRSIFLQGLLLMKPADRPRKFDRWASIWHKYDAWLERTGLTPLQACLGHALHFEEISKIVVGVDSQNHLREILQAVSSSVSEIPSAFAINDAELVNPARWVSL